MSAQNPPDASIVRRLAVAARVDPRTILAVLRGEPVRGDAGHRARAALVAAGLLPPDGEGIELPGETIPARRRAT